MITDKIEGLFSKFSDTLKGIRIKLSHNWKCSKTGSDKTEDLV